MPSVINLPEAKYGRRLLPAVLDELANDEPNKVLFYSPKTNDEADGYHEVTSSQLANAVNRMAWWLEDTLGEQHKAGSVGYIGPSDLRYFVLIIAGAKTGYKIFLSSPRNSLEGHLSLIKDTRCTAWLVPTGVNVEPILKNSDVTPFDFPELINVIDSKPVDKYHYSKRVEDGFNDILTILHTSGSTGLPKPIPIKLGGFCHMDAMRHLEPIDGKEVIPLHFKGAKMLITMPPFHAARIFGTLLSAFAYDCPNVFPPPGPITVATFEKAVDYAGANAAFIAPSTLDEVVKTPSALAKLDKLRFIVTGGGPTSKSTGDILVSKTNFFNLIGSTEAFLYPLVPADKDAWNYFRFHPKAGMDFRPTSGGLHELVFVRQEGNELNQPVFITFPDLKEWNTKDLYSKHPTKEGYWRYEGRNDDIIVLSNGEKFNPLSMEEGMLANPKVKSALVVGQARFQTGMIIEPAVEVKDAEKFIDEIWPIVEKCNNEAPSHARVQKQMIMLTAPDKPFSRAPKGTIQRRATLNLYKVEIDDLYNKVESAILADEFDLSSEETIKKGVHGLIAKVLEAGEFSDDDDFFALGMDSLMVLTIQRSLQAAVGAKQTVMSRLIYENPTVIQLSKAVNTLIHAEQVDGESTEESRVQAMRDAIAKHSWGLPPVTTDKASIIVTGTTGTLGCYILDSLVNNPRVAKVWCLNRSADAEARQIKSAEERGLRSDWGSKVSFLHANLTAPFLGLKAVDYHDIIENLTHVIHNSWRVDFNLSLPSFESQLVGTKQLLDVCYNTRRRCSFQFISSIAVGQNWAAHHEGPIPEKAINNLSAATMGYGESKLTAEHIVERAGRGGIVDAKITRVGQIAGPVKQGGAKGKWNPNEWLPTIVLTSAKLAMVPTSLGQFGLIDWIPVDTLSDIVAELALNPLEAKTDSAAFFHLVNPKKASWSDLYPVVQKQLQEKLQCPVKTVSFHEWIDELKKVAQKQSASGVTGGDDFVTGVKLIDFYEGLAGPKEVAADTNGEKKNTEAVYEMSETVRLSKHMGELDIVNPEWMKYWMEQWGF